MMGGGNGGGGFASSVLALQPCNAALKVSKYFEFYAKSDIGAENIYQANSESFQNAR